MRIRGPMVTLGAVAALAIGLWLANVSQEEAAAPPQNATESTAAPPSTPAPPAPPAFPARADYVGKVPTAAGAITLEITVDGNRAIAYACDGNTIETWLRGSAANGAVSLADKDKSSRLEGRLQGTAVAGTLWIDGKKWDFTAPLALPPAGLYVYDDAGVRSSWIVDADGAVTGVLRLDDGTTRPAPALETDGTAVIDGRTVTAVRVQGDSDV